MKSNTSKLVSAAVLTGLVTLTLAGCGGGGGGDGTAVLPFTFRTEASTMYTRVDRMGEPALATAFLHKDPGVSDVAGKPTSSPTKSQRDDFNAGDPAGDGNNFAGQIVFTLAHLHAQLDPQVRGLGLTTCSTGAVSSGNFNQSQCLTQAAGALVPDVLTLDNSGTSSWPNGRHPDDPVVDRLLAAGLLDLRVSGQNINTLSNSGLLSPKYNDGNASADLSPTEFPYFRPKHAGP